MNKLSIDEIFEAIMQLKTTEIVTLATLIKDKCNIEVGTISSGSTASNEEEESSEEKTYKVTLINIGQEKIKAMKSIRDVLKVTLAEAKALVENVPSQVKEGISKEAADVLVNHFKEQPYNSLEFEIKADK